MAEQWWHAIVAAMPWRTWFWGYNQHNNSYPGTPYYQPRTDILLTFTNPGLPSANYEMYRIPADSNHPPQLVIRSPINLTGARPIVYNRLPLSLTANMLYFLVDPGDTPNWGTATTTRIAPPCENWEVYLYVVNPVPDLINITGQKVDSLTGLPLHGWEITLENSVGVTRTALTDAEGRYSFTGLPREVYSVRETIQTDWVCTLPDALGRYDGITTAVGSGTVNFVRNFANYLPEPPPPPPPPDIINITGVKRDHTGRLLAGWIICLKGALSEVMQTVTDSVGAYAFTGLPLDEYEVYEIIRPGWNCIVPGITGKYTGITAEIGSGTTEFIRNFVNVWPPVERSQTSAIQAAVEAQRSKSIGVIAAVEGDLLVEVGLYSACENDRSISCGQYAAIRGETGTTAGLNAAIYDEPDVSIELIAAVATEFAVSSGLLAVVQKTFVEHVWMKAAVCGEPPPLQCALRARVIISRLDQIRLEMEPWLPQDLAINSAPNMPSVPRDSRVQRLGGG